VDAEAYADMLPWFVFVVVDRRYGLDVTWAAASAAVCALGLVVWSYWRGLRSPVPKLGLVAFSACLLVAFVVPAWDAGTGLPRAVMVGILSLAAFVSLRGTPMSEAYTVAQVAPAVRHDTRFRQVNLDITCAWGIGTALVAVACGTTVVIRDAYAFTFLGWVAPLVLAGSTMLWAARRWDLFRVAVDGAGIGASGNRGTLFGVPARGPSEVYDGADIRQFPIRRERDA